MSETSTPARKTASKRIYGLALILTLGGVDYMADIKEYELAFEDADSDDLTFAEAAAGGGDKAKLTIKAIQSTDTESFWTYVWKNAGAKDVAVAIAPHGNATPTASQPHIVGPVNIGNRPNAGGKADPKSSYEFEIEWDATIARELKTTK